MSLCKWCDVTETQRGIVGCEDGGRSPEPSNAGISPPEAGKGKETRSPLEPPERSMALLTSGF